MEAVTPKLHFMLHYPEHVLNVGPIVHTWNMRNEAKLNICRQAGRLGNFKNIGQPPPASGYVMNCPQQSSYTLQLNVDHVSNL